MIAACLLILMSIYLVCGLVFAAPFALVGVGKIDSHASHGSWGFRLLIVPGTILLWPLLAMRWLKGVHEPPEERNAHRLSAERRMQNAEWTEIDSLGKSAPPCSVSGRLHSKF